MRRTVISRLALTCLAIGFAAGCSTGDGSGEGPQPSRPTITSFAASPTSIRFGEAVALTWVTTGATSVSITDDQGGTVETDGQLSGSAQLQPEGTTTWTLVARNDAGQVSDTVRVTVDDLVEPRVTFGASPEQIAPGATSTLTWTVTDAARVVLRSGDEILEVSETVFSGSRPVTPTETTTYVLEASGPGGSASRDVTVTVTSAPLIRTFTSTPPAIRAGATETVQLAWTIDGTLTSLELMLPGIPEPAPVDLPLASEGTHEVTISASSTFTLVATNDAGSTQRTVTIEALDAPMISRFTANATLVGANDPFTLTWSTGAATSVVLERGGVVVAENLEAAGSMEQRVTGPATFTLRASNSVGSEAADVSVDVGAPRIESFDASLSQGAPGAEITFTWMTVAATSVRVVSDEGDDICAASDPTELAGGTCKGVVPETTAGFRLVAENGSGATTSELFPFVAASGPVIQTFRVSPVIVSVGGEVTIRWEVTRDANGAIPEIVIEDRDGNAVDLGGADPLDGSIKLTFDAVGTYSFTLTATTPDMEPAVATRTLEVVARPAIASFTATPPSFDPSNPSVVLAWQSSGGTSAEIHVTAGGSIFGSPVFSSANAAVVANGSHTAHPFAPTAYRLTVRNSAGDSDTADVELQPGVGITDFSTNAAQPVAPGSTVTLNWNTAGGRVYLKGMVEVPAANAPFVDVSGAGVMLVMNDCGAGGYSSDEGCVDLDFGSAGFAFPFDGTDRTSIRVFANGVLGFDFDAEPGIASRNSQNLPTSSYGYVQFAPFWTDLWPDVDTYANPGVFAGVVEEPVAHGVIQWKNNIIGEAYDWEADSDINFEVVFWENGSFEYRYARMWAGIDWWFGANHQPVADGQTVSIGYQNVAGTVGYMVNSGKTAVPGGLSNRSFRAELNAPSVGSLDVVVRRTTTYELCVDTGDVEDICEQLTVTTN